MSQLLPASFRIAICALLAMCVLTGAAAEAAETVIVTIDRAKIIKAPDGTQTLIIGNPLVADVTMLKATGSMVITGHSFGSTNLIALDGAGNVVVEAIIKVTGNEQSLTVLRGSAQESYSCSPLCAPTVALGDDNKYMDASIAGAKARSGAVSAGGK